MAKKNSVSYPPKQQAPSMSPSHPHTVGGSSLVLEDDDDDICPVCESECTCRNRASPAQASRSDVIAPSAPFTTTSNGSAAVNPSLSSVGLQSLKIKLTVPPNLKFRKQHSIDQANVGADQARSLLGSSPPDASESPASSVPTNVSAHQLALSVLDPAAPKRRGRPPKALVAARKAAEAALAAGQNTPVGGIVDHSPGGNGFAIVQATGKGKQVSKYTAPKGSAAVGRGKFKGKTTTGRKIPASSFVKRSLPRSFSDDAISDRFPTFVSAASTSTHSSSSESSESESELSSLDSEIEEETRLLMRGGKRKTHVGRISGPDGSQKRHDYSGGNEDTRSLKSSMSMDEGANVDSEDSSDGQDDELEDDSEDETTDEDADADTEGGGLDDLEPDPEETSSRIGLTFGDGAAGWSDDEESSLDADLFFANLDGSSDSDSSREADDRHSFEPESDSELQYSFSVDEEDALFLMDIDRSVQVRRNNGEFELGLELDSLSFGWDGQLLLTSSSPQNIFNLGFELQRTEYDVEMQNGSQPETDSTYDESATVDETLLLESDGETTEDELVDADGLPNSRAMMLFRWPTTVSAINPMSTLGQTATSPSQAPPNVSESIRIALASFSAHQGSPAPTPADILSGKMSMEDLEDIEMDKLVGHHQQRNSRTSGPPTMGEFVPIPDRAEHSAVIDGKGGCVPSPFPRSHLRRSKRASETECDDSASAMIDPPSESIMSSTQSSDEALIQSQLQTSELSSTDAIELDDVLDSSFLDSESTMHDHELQPYDRFAMSDDAASGMHIHSLSRWDRIPMATFRRTRETVISSTLEGSASDTGLSVFHSMGSMFGGTMLNHPRPEKKSSSARKRSKGKGLSSLVIPNDPLSLRDLDRTPTSGTHQPFKPSKKEARREKAMLKRKMVGKPASYRPQQYHNHHHHPNNKTRTSGSMQRMSSFGGSNSMPSFNM